MSEKMTFQRIFFSCEAVLFGGILFLMPAAFAKGVTVKEVKAKRPVPYLGRDYRDPTLNPLLSKPAQEETTAVKEVVTLPPISIQGVVWGGSSPNAIIDGRVVRKGDTLPEGVEILDISGAGIKVLYRGKIFTILPQGVVEE